MLSKTNLLFGLILGVPIGYGLSTSLCRNADNETVDKTDALTSQLYLMTKYNKWAYNQIDIWCKKNNSDDTDIFNQNTEIPFKTIRNTLCHLWVADQIWYNRMFSLNESQLKSYKGHRKTICNDEMFTFWTSGHENDGKFEKLFDGMHVDEIFDVLKQSSDKWIDTVECFANDNEATDTFTYKHRSGRVFKQKKSSVIAHVVNHATHHRGQISAVATQLCPNAKPIQLDLAVWERMNIELQNITTINIK